MLLQGHGWDISLFLLPPELGGHPRAAHPWGRDLGITDKFGLERTFKGHLVQPPCKERGTPAEIPRGRNAPWNL